MTVRAKPVVRRRQRPWEGPERRNFLTNVGFGLVVLVALIVLAVAAGLAWYDQHLAPVASVNGQSITKDDLARRFRVEEARLSIAESRIQDEFNAGRLTADQRDAQLQFLAQRQQQLASNALERLIDARVQADLARQEGVEVTDADVEARITKEATRPEQRYVWEIEVAPKVEGDATEPTAAAKAEAKKKADQALADLKAGKDWVEVAKAVSTGSTASTGGELGWVSEGFDPDPAFEDAVFALPKDGLTDVIETEDGSYRIGRVTDIAAESVDPDYRSIMTGRGVPLDAFEEAIRQDAVADKLRDRIQAQALAAGPQRRVAEIFLEDPSLPAALPEGAVKTRHILYAPKDDPTGAGDLPATDPAWAEAEAAARKAYETLQKDISKFDQLARTESDEGSADVSGGKLPWFDPSQVAAGQLDRDFGAAIFKEGLQPGQLLEPVKSSFGWHVIQVMYLVPDVEEAKALKAQLEGGADFAQLARDYSAGAEAAEGGELGWIARFQLDLASEQAIFATPVGGITDPVSVDGDGVHLYKVLEEATRTPEGTQKSQLEDSAFTNWYTGKKAAYTIDRELATGGG